jgi:hypothetical protein
MKITKYTVKKYTLSTLVFIFMATALFASKMAFAADLIPCDGTPESPCGFNEVMALINTIVNFILGYAILPIAVVVFVYGGFLYMTSGSDAAKRTKAKKMFVKLLWGIFFCMAAWVIVKIILETFGYDTELFSPIIGA